MSTPQSFKDLILREWEADRVDDDVTTRLLGERGSLPSRAILRSKQAGIFSGETIVAAYAECLGATSTLKLTVRDGDSLAAGSDILEWRAPVATCLTRERTLLNLLTHACGIATQTRAFVQAVRPYPVRILATRKTLPGLRDLQLLAVVAGGGFVHRRSLSDGILIKDNHLAVSSERALLERAREVRSPLHKVEIEVQSLNQLDLALAVGADVIMLDNLPLSEMKEAITRIGKRAEIEISGGVSIEKAREYAALGVSYLSVGSLTHSVKALDLSLDIELGAAK